MPVESDGHSRGNPRIYELIENTPKEGKSPTVWAWPQFVEFLKVAGQPVQGPWPPNQQPRPDPTDIDGAPVAIPDPLSAPMPPAFAAPAPAPPVTPDAASDSADGLPDVRP